MKSISWSNRRKAKMAALAAMLLSIGAAVFLAVRKLPISFIDPSALPDASADIQQQMGPFSFLLAIRGLDDLLKSHPDVTVAIAGALTMGGLLYWTLAERLHDHFLASFNNEILIPIVAVTATTDRDARFVTLDWMLGETGMRRDAWDGLTRWIGDMVRRQGPLLWDGGPAKPYSIGFLSGRAGSGKSRLAGELARAIGRRDIIGDARHRDASRSVWRRRSDRARLIIGAYLRRTMPFLRPRRDDPWDAGVIRNQSGVDNIRTFSDKLGEWRPRRPTLLILDDPGPGDTSAIHAVLSAIAAKAAHPICLLVVNQVIPFDAPLTFDAQSREWRFDVHAPADPAPFVLPAESWFGRKDTIRLAFANSAMADASPALEREVRDHLYRVTNGNPLMITLALEWITAHGRLQDVTPEQLRGERVRRVIAGIRDNQVIAPSQWTQLVLASMVGGASRAAIIAAIRAEQVIDPVSELPEPARLQACFPSDILFDGVNASHVPPIRPDLLVAALIDTLAESGMDIGAAAALVRGGFRLDPAMLLRQRRALNTSAYLKEALASIDPKTIPGISALQWAYALIDHAVHAGPGDPETWSTVRQAERMAKAEAMIQQLDATERRALLPMLAALVSANQAPDVERRIIPAALLRCVHCVAQPGAVAVEPDYWLALYESLEETATKAETDLGPLDAPIRAAQSLSVDWYQASRLHDTVFRMGYYWRAMMLPVLQALKPDGAGPLAQIRAMRIEAAVAAIQVLPEKAQHAAEQAAALAAAYPEDAAIMREAASARRYEAYGWGEVAGGAEAAAAGVAAEQVSAIATRFPDDATIQEAAVRAWQAAAFGWSQVSHGAGASTARDAADKAALIAAAFPTDLAIQRAVAEARISEAFAWCLVPKGARADCARQAAEQVAAIKAACPVDRQIQLEAATAQRLEAFAWSQVPGGTQAAAARAAAEQAAAWAAAFPSHGLLQHDAVEARQSEAFAWSQVPNGAQAGACQSAAEQAVALAAPFPADRSLQYHAATALCHEAYCWGQVPAGSQAAPARAAADKVAAIAAPFDKDNAFQAKAAEARESEVWSWSQVPGGAKAALAHLATEQILEAAADFPDCALLHTHAARALRMEAYAWGQVPEGAKAISARAAADKALAIAKAFPDEVDILLEAAAARRMEVWARSQVPAGAQAAAAQAAAEQVVAVAAACPTDAIMQREVAWARRMTAWGWSQVPHGARAAASRTAAEEAAIIAAAFPDDGRIQAALAEARRSEIFAWCHVPDRAGLAEAEATFAALAKLAATFPDNSAIQTDVQLARSYLPLE